MIGVTDHFVSQVLAAMDHGHDHDHDNDDMAEESGFGAFLVMLIIFVLGYLAMRMLG